MVSNTPLPVSDLLAEALRFRDQVFRRAGVQPRPGVEAGLVAKAIREGGPLVGLVRTPAAG
ncbi:hypothetical protein GCM10011594_14170 [Nakamurella endophytica]|uniref:Uncharacterized protein n=2 Tax=Nakamurella endophytica TaxID=1748367 RepID=A0A917SSK3_9ACTN|nr:hypothetical protein GCM10011594_14170 [Nakamurella endophytica]